MARYIKVGTPTTIAEIDSNLEAIEVAIADMLSRKGDAPNQMDAPLDMNDYGIINIAPPTADTDLVRLIDLENIASPPPTSIGTLPDVDVTSTPPLVGEVLVWDGVNWVPQSAPAADITSSTIGQLSDVTLTTPSLDDVLTWNGAEWVAQVASGGGGGSLSQLTTVPVPSSTLSDLGFMELQSAGNYNLPLANTVATNTIINVTVTSTYSANAPKILVQGGDTITDSTGVDVDGELLFAGAISIKLISDGISSWRY